MTAHPHRLLIAYAMLIVAMLASASAWGQAVGHPAAGPIAEQRDAVAALSESIEALEAEVEEDPGSDARLVEINLALGELRERVLAINAALKPRLAEINSRLEQLGPPPGDGSSETDIVPVERQRLQSQRAEINAVLSLAEELSTRIDRLGDRISVLRSELFQSFFIKRYPLAETFDSALRIDVRAELTALYRAFASWLGFVYQFKFKAALAAAGLSLAAALVLLVGGRRLFQRFFPSHPEAQNPSYLKRLSVAFWSTLLPTAALGLFLASTLFFLDQYRVLRGDIGVYLRSLFLVIGVVFGINRVVRTTLSPGYPNWRLIPVAAAPGRWLVALSTAIAVVIGLNTFLGVVNQQMGSPLSLTIARSFLASVVAGGLLILMAFVKPYRDADGAPLPWPGWLRNTAFAIGGFTILAALLGYVGLALFLSIQIVVTGAVLLTAYIGFLASRAIGAEGGFASSSLGRRLAGRYNLRETTIDQLGLATSIGINLLILLVFLPIVLLLWGFQPGDIQAWLQRLGQGFTVGSFSFSPAGILTGVLIFILGYLVTRWFQGWIDGSVMARGRVDSGVRNSIRTVIGYVGVALAAIIAVSSAGIDLSSLALIAGGLSLGIGFGLQNIVSNFVSGLILLAERPFKAGDWIVAGDVSGTVKKISVRATEIETFQRQTVIMPNSELINRAVGNWTLRNRLGRIDIKVNVAYDSDARKAHQIMQEIADGHPAVLRNPEPFVLFVNFGPAALEFEMRLFLADITNGNVVQNDIRFAVMERFEREGIAIPSTVRADVLAMKAARAAADLEGGEQTG